MKKSNIILAILLISLYLIPVCVWGFYKVSSASNYYTGLSGAIRIVQIENAGLSKSDIIVNTEKQPAAININNMGGSYLYYKGSKKYLPEITKEDDTLIIGKAIDTPSGEKLKLHICISSVDVIRLNGEVVWRR